MNDMYCNECFDGCFYQPNPLTDYRSNYVENDYSHYPTVDRLDSFFNPAEGFSKGNMQMNIYKPYKLTNPSMPATYNERQRMLLEVQKFGFAMWDLNLYLNTHPMDRNVMMLFDQYRNMYKKAKSEYEGKYGALCFENTNSNLGYWPWNKNTWPWEGE